MCCLFARLTLMLIFLHDVLTGAQLVHQRDRQWKLRRCSASVLEETKRKASLDDSGTISKSRKFEQMPQESTPVGVCARVCVCVYVWSRACVYVSVWKKKNMWYKLCVNEAKCKEEYPENSLFHKLIQFNASHACCTVLLVQQNVNL